MGKNKKLEFIIIIQIRIIVYYISFNLPVS